MLDPEKIMLVRQEIGLGHKNISELARKTGLTRPTVYKYLKELKKQGYTTKRSGKDVIIESNIDKILANYLHQLKVQIFTWESISKHTIKAYKKPHPKSKMVNLAHKSYRYRLAYFNNMIAALLAMERGIFYLKSISGIRKQNIHELNETSKRCLALITKIQEEVIKITPDHEKEIIDFFASNVINSVIPQPQIIKFKIKKPVSKLKINYIIRKK